MSDGPHATGIIDGISDGPVPLPAVDGGRVAWSSADGRLPTGDGNSDGCITTGFQRWKEASVCEPLEHSVQMMTLDDSPMEKMSDDEPVEHSVLDAAVTCRRVAGVPVRPPLQCSVMTMGLARGLRTEDGGPPFVPDPKLTLSDGLHATGIIDRISDGPIPFSAVDGGRVAWSSADGRLLTGDGNSDGCITTGFQRWNMYSDVEDQYETFNGMPVYYGGDLYDSENSDWDDLCSPCQCGVCRGL